MKKNTEAKKKEQLRRNEEKWTVTLMDAGWTLIPSVFLERQQALGLDPIDINIILQLARFWWFSENPPRPSKRTIAECIGVDISTVRRRIAAMERAGYIKRVSKYDPKYGGQKANEYNFNGLIQSAKPLAEELIAERERRHQETAARRTRKKPRLSVVDGEKQKDL